ncbi:MAG TPA: hypothetical protein VFW83_01295, partial [Bryobacteraceae bacterium]|nr:hypothetical protein [Bryobacteraceae bacterium]
MKIPKLFAIAISVAVLSVLAHAAPSTAKKLGKTVRRRRRAAPRVSARARAKAQAFVAQQIEDGAKIPVENAAGLLPFFEQLFRNQQAALKGPVRILQYGDSHTAADLWTGELRSRFQEKFGDGGSGFSLAGRPYRGYRRADVLSGSSSGWHADGL